MNEHDRGGRGAGGENFAVATVLQRGGGGTERQRQREKVGAKMKEKVSTIHV